MKKNTLIVLSIYFFTAIALPAVDIGLKMDITSVDVESGLNIPLSGTSYMLDYKSGTLLQLNFQLEEDDRLTFSLSTGYGSYESPYNNIAGLYNFTALLGVGYNIAIGETPVSITPSIYGGVLGHILKSDMDSMDNLFDNLQANHILGADLEAAFTPVSEDDDSSLGFYLAGSLFVFSNSESKTLQSCMKAGVRYYFP